MPFSAGPVLIVEDDLLLAMDLSEILSDAGYALCDPAADNASARSIIRANAPGFAFLDYNLGCDTSVATACELQTRGIPFVYVTGRPDAVRLDHAAPRAPILAKPYDPRDILLALESA